MFNLRETRRSQPKKTELIIFLVILVGCNLAAWRVRLGGWGITNHGGVFGWFAQAWWWTFLLAGCWGLVLWGLSRISQPEWRWPMIIILAAGGANIVDRLISGGVTDYIYYPFFNVYGNIADILLGLSALWLILISIRQPKVK